MKTAAFKRKGIYECLCRSWEGKTKFLYPLQNLTLCTCVKQMLHNEHWCRIKSLRILHVWVTHKHVSRSPRQAWIGCALPHMYILSVWNTRMRLDKTALILPEPSIAVSKGTWWKSETSSLTFSSGDGYRYTLYSLIIYFQAALPCLGCHYVCSVETWRRGVIHSDEGQSVIIWEIRNVKTPTQIWLMQLFCHSWLCFVMWTRWLHNESSFYCVFVSKLSSELQTLMRTDGEKTEPSITLMEFDAIFMSFDFCEVS